MHPVVAVGKPTIARGPMRWRQSRNRCGTTVPSGTINSIDLKKFWIGWKDDRDSGINAEHGIERSGRYRMKPSRCLLAGFWISTLLFAFQMSFTAYAQLRLPQVAAAFAHLGFPGYFRVELSWAKFVGVAVLLIPIVPSRWK